MQQSSFSWNKAFMPLASTPDVPWQSRLLWEGIDEVFSASLVLRYLNPNLVMQNKSHNSSALLPLEWLRSHVVLHFWSFRVRISVMASGRVHLYIRMNDINTLRDPAVVSTIAYDKTENKQKHHILQSRTFAGAWKKEMIASFNNSPCDIVAAIMVAREDVFSVI